MGAPTIPTRETARSRHGGAPCGNGIDHPRRMSSSEDARINSVKAHTDHASRLRDRSLIALPTAGRCQPQRDVLRLHSLPHDRDQLAAQGFEVGLISQLRGERFEGLGGIVFPPIEQPIYEPLYAPAQWVEQGRYRKGGGNDG